MKTWNRGFLSMLLLGLALITSAVIAVQEAMDAFARRLDAVVDFPMPDEERRRLKSVVASVSVENELLREKIARMENGRPLAFWKSKP